MTRQPIDAFGLDGTTDEVIATVLDVHNELADEREAAARGK